MLVLLAVTLGGGTSGPTVFPSTLGYAPAPVVRRRQATVVTDACELDVGSKAGFGLAVTKGVLGVAGKNVFLAVVADGLGASLDGL